MYVCRSKVCVCMSVCLSVCLFSGGREMWLEYVNSVPPAWTVSGLWITYNRIIGLMTTIITFGGTIMITYALTGTASSG